MYAELHCLSNFTFLRGASRPEELVNQAQALGYTALALTDECSLAGVVRAHVVAKRVGLKLLIGSEFRLEDGLRLVLLAKSRRGYGQLSSLITTGRRRASKGSYQLTRTDLMQDLSDCVALWLPDKQPAPVDGRWLAELFPQRLWMAIALLREGTDRARLQRWQACAGELGMPMVATGDVHLHERQRRPMQNVLTAIRLGCAVSDAGFALHANAERHLRSLPRLQKLYPPALLQESLRVAEQCQFSLDELRYEYPSELVPPGVTPSEHLQQLTTAGMRQRWPQGTPQKVLDLVAHELKLIAEMHYEPYFLTVHDIVRFARSRAILCQGRGSAANSAVCYCLGITEVDPSRMEMLFERFISKERDEPPDIDVDFEHERREEVIQYIYQKYTRERAALAATVVTYRARSALRDVAKAMGMDAEHVDRLAKSSQWWDGREINQQRLRAAGFDPDNAVLQQVLSLATQLMGFPRHLSQHVGGFVISRGPLSQLVPVENASMPERTVIQWDKDDLEALGLMKVDVLALGMLSAIRRCFDLIADYYGKRLTMADIPAEDPRVYQMMQRADTVGVFQIESRAQMAMLPRLKPKTFYDLVIEVSLVRPGPIQGNMVHPYLRRRQGLEAVTYPSESVRDVLARTLGVPIFQEQVIKLAMVAAGFSAGEADQLRRAMAAWKRKGGLEPFEEKLINGMRMRGYSEVFATQVFEQIKGFGEYGFPESHAASFSLLVYVSAWLKCYQAAAFTCALLNSQPMGFYAPAQLVRDAREHNVEVRPVDVCYSDWDCTLETSVSPGAQTRKPEPALRLGLCMVKSLSYNAAEKLVHARRVRMFSDVQDLVYRAGLHRGDQEALAAANALSTLAGNRHQARWLITGVEESTPLAYGSMTEQLPLLPEPGEGENIVADYASVGLSLGRHPMALLRNKITTFNLRSAAQLKLLSHGRHTRTAGLVIARQRPMSASGVMFITLEDETGVVNVVVWESLVEKWRKEIVSARLLVVAGVLERDGEVMHLIARHVKDQSHLLGELQVYSRDFH